MSRQGRICTFFGDVSDKKYLLESSRILFAFATDVYVLAYLHMKELITI